MHCILYLSHGILYICDIHPTSFQSLCGFLLQLIEQRLPILSKLHFQKRGCRGPAPRRWLAIEASRHSQACAIQCIAYCIFSHCILYICDISLSSMIMHVVYHTKIIILHGMSCVFAHQASWQSSHKQQMCLATPDASSHIPYGTCPVATCPVAAVLLLHAGSRAM